VDAAVRGLIKSGMQVVVILDAIKELPSVPIEDMLHDWIELGVKFVLLDQTYAEKDSVCKKLIDLEADIDSFPIRI
jgi:hypothetical protein